MAVAVSAAAGAVAAGAGAGVVEHSPPAPCWAQGLPRRQRPLPGVTPMIITTAQATAMSALAMRRITPAPITLGPITADPIGTIAIMVAGAAPGGDLGALLC